MAKRPRYEEALPSFFESLYTSQSTDANEIASGLFLGAAAAAEDRPAMQKRRISHVLICHPKLPEAHAKYFKYGRVDLIDDPTQNLLELLPDAIDFAGGARRKGGRVFVYCMKGISRSASVVIALLMLERKIGFDEAFRVCEQRRGVVYPNVGFQQQLRHLQKIMSACAPEASWVDRMLHLRASVPGGSLDGPKAPLRIRDEIGNTMGHELQAVEELAEKIFTQPTLLQQSELWKRHGLFFENLHKYKALPSDDSLIARAKAASSRLRTLPKVFSETLKGVKFGLAVAKEINSWLSFAEPALANLTKAMKPLVAYGDDEDGSGKDEADEEDPMAGMLGQEQPEDDSDSSSDSSGKKKKKKKKKGKDKDKKKDKKAKDCETRAVL